MMRSSAGISLLCLTFLIGSLAACDDAQKRPSVEELLRFFPMDTYWQVTHEETAAMTETLHHMDFRDRGRLALIRSRFPFPNRILDQAESITHAVLTHAFVYVRTEEEPSRRIPNSLFLTWMDVAGKPYTAEGVGEDLIIMRYADPQAVIKKVLESGDITEVGPGSRGLTVYSGTSKDMRGFERTQLMVALGTGEILCAESVEMLARMLKAGAGEEASILDEPGYQNLKESFTYLGHHLEYSFSRPMDMAILKYVENNVKDINPEEIEKARKERKNVLGYSEERVAVEDLSGPQVTRSIYFYLNEKSANFEKSRWIEGGMREDDPYRAAVHNASTYVVFGKRLIVTLTYDRETKQKLKQARQEAVREEKKKAAEEKEEKKQK